MATLAADPNIVIVDVEGGETDHPTTITYNKEKNQEIWERNTPGGGWSERTFLPGAEESGDYSERLAPGQSYEAGIFYPGHGPFSLNPIQQATLIVYGLRKKPEDRALITNENEAFGGTWYWHQVFTKVPTSIVSVEVSRKSPTINALGIPIPVDPEGNLTPPLSVMFVNDHQVEFKGDSPFNGPDNFIYPGNLYFFSVVVVDVFGNWDLRIKKFTTLRRQFDVQFVNMRVDNDGDPLGRSDAEFRFKVYSGSPRTANVIDEFDIYEEEITDGGTYSLGFTHSDPLQAVMSPGQMRIWANSWATENDGVFEPNEHAYSRDQILPFPTGRFEKVTTWQPLTLDCTPTDDDDFHYHVDMQWKVDYVA